MTGGRRIAVVTTSRADYGILRPLLRRLDKDPACDLRIIAGGMHLSPRHGNTIDEIIGDGFAPAARVDLLTGDDSPLGTARSMARGVEGFAAAFADLAPDLVVVLGDRFEVLAAVVAAQPLRLPVAHLHGGELTLGALDDAFRHAITKMSHLHFAAAEPYARRLRQMGEEEWRVIVSGAPGLDNLRGLDPLDDASLANRVGLPLDPAPLLVTYHPATREPASVAAQVAELLAALDGAGRPMVFTAPNADPGGEVVRRAALAFVAGRRDAVMCPHLGTRAYFSLMARAAAMVGNSSSGLIEAPSFQLPVVNVGRREAGRLRAANVIDVAEDRAAIKAGIAKALDPAFRAGLAGLVNPLAADRPAADTIAERLLSVPLDDRLLDKGFVDLPAV
ncbi:MAG: UDP-N-acetylglucosamine 2-epimerase (hydrolyzing) [Hyphomicrobiales bacterium]|nr:UDP-N-acetylglucosamine 2-epimerase (hydrolyzing) [Hyphomicrobiales bacterium]